MNFALNTRLMDAFQFNDSDLDANRHGRLSDAQKREWDDSRAFFEHSAVQAGSPRSMILVVVFVLAIFGAVGAGLVATGTLPLDNPAIIPAAAVGLLFVLFIVRSAISAQRSSIAIAAKMGDAAQSLPSVAVISGRAQTLHEISHSRTGAAEIGRRQDHYFLVVGDGRGTTKMRIPQRGMGAFEPGQDYTVYYYESWGVPTFLSAETRP